MEKILYNFVLNVKQKKEAYSMWSHGEEDEGDTEKLKYVFGILNEIKVQIEGQGDSHT